MMRNSRQPYNDRVRRTSRGIVLALALTIAAGAFLVTAIERRARSTAAITDPVPAPAESAN